MGLFSRKTKTDATDFARTFYDRYIFGADPSGGDFEATYAKSCRRLIAESDSSFADVSLQTLTEELRALHLEMIGTSWTHQSKTEVALAVSQFTKKYLADIDRSDLWDAMTDYNQAVAESATYGADPNSATGRARIAFINRMRADLFDSLIAHASDPDEAGDAIARVANRIGSEQSWKAGTAQVLLAIRVIRRLNTDRSDSVIERLAAVSYGFYEGAKEALDNVKLTA